MQQALQVVSSEFPLKEKGEGLVVFLKLKQPYRTLSDRLEASCERWWRPDSVRSFQPAGRPCSEEYAEHFGDDKDNLAVGDIQKECLPHPLAPFLPPL